MTISAHWQTQIEKWETSGLTLVIFCQQNNLKYSTFLQGSVNIEPSIERCQLKRR